MTETAKTEPAVALWRLYALRLIYLAIFVGLSRFVWEGLLFRSADWSLMTGIAQSMFAALALLCLLGLRYPLQMLPLIFFETVWKLIWLALIALPAVRNARWAEISTTVYECIGVILVFFILPWGYVWRRYVSDPGDRWRNARKAERPS